LDEPKKRKHRRDCQDENKSKSRELSKDRQSPPATGTSAASFGFVSGQRLLPLLAMEFLGVLVLETESLSWQILEDRRLGERLRPPEFFIYRVGEEIVTGDRGAYPKKFGKWRDFLSRTVAESFGIPIESYSV
jgi:hypothetical protein